ncbi:hypothetical protein [Mycolicibacter kumamotonensis]|uniref:Uncharacterized protein n=1 Tax=Mycolicibacter kumamotonensis TaxID=354243 RepID=A0A7K3LGH1_9MYCO|nr:hypothetical protein [Mycolicibacter kumamotonensis]NDJ91451.1 hypothetical protein [Mycolicibacter kumamotonensis]
MNAPRRYLVDAMVAEADARRRATEEGRDPEQCPEVAALKAQLGVQQQLAQRVNGPRREGYDPLRGLQHTRVIGP